MSNFSIEDLRNVINEEVRKVVKEEVKTQIELLKSDTSELNERCHRRASKVEHTAWETPPEAEHWNMDDWRRWEGAFS